MKILIVGSGGRESAIAKKLNESRLKPRLFNVGSHYNPQIYELCKGHVILSEDIDEVIKFCRREAIDFAIIGPEKYLELAWSDNFWSSGIPCFGPHKLFARIETSKYFARLLMDTHRMKQFNPKFYYANSREYTTQKDFIDKVKNIVVSNFNSKNYVMKVDGLMGGKGVQVYGDHFLTIHEALLFAEQIYQKKEGLVIEEKLEGKEFSLLSITDGNSFIHLPLIKDFKRAFENDVGPNTGGMGCISYEDHSMPFLSDEESTCAHQVNESIISILNDKYKYEHSMGYRGIIYGSFMKTSSGLKVIEFNSRFGDPECINGLALMDGDFAQVCKDTVLQTLHLLVDRIKFKKSASVLKYIVPKGYPLDTIIGEEKITLTSYNNCYLSSVGVNTSPTEYPLLTPDNRGEFYMYGSRAIGVLNVGESVEQCAEKVNNFIENNIIGNIHYRKDIGMNDADLLTSKNIISNIHEKSEKDTKYARDAYAKAGVNIEEGTATVKKIEQYVTDTFNENVVSKFGDFAGIYNLKSNGNSLLVFSTDGVGTKTELTRLFFKEKGFEKLGHDIVNHCVNDILVKGARPLCFMDYFASSTLDSEQVKFFVKGISEACVEAKCALMGGETAEMPGIYKEGKCDLAGCIVGLIDEPKYLIDGKKNIQKDDVVMALSSSGPHTNGFSLIRKLIRLNPKKFDMKDILRLCEPHRSYLTEILKIRDTVDIHGLCHITGGGLIDNPLRVLPDNMTIQWKDWILPPIFKKLQTVGDLSKTEMWKTFNCGLGMLIIVSKTDSEKVKKLLPETFIVGRVSTKYVIDN